MSKFLLNHFNTRIPEYLLLRDMLQIWMQIDRCSFANNAKMLRKHSAGSCCGNILLYIINWHRFSFYFQHIDTSL